jgi:hypothetical protein
MPRKQPSSSRRWSSAGWRSDGIDMHVEEPVRANPDRKICLTQLSP